MGGDVSLIEPALLERHVELRSGSLDLRVLRADLSLDELLGFAARANPKRGFLFVSKVLGKHIPCRPHVMRRVYETLADLIGPLDSGALVIGMAETATGLGAGVADSLARRHEPGQIISQHTTRHPTSGDLWVTFDESHSHAPDHLLYRPLNHIEMEVNRARSLVLVDDEITSGRTLMMLAREIEAAWSGPLDEIVLVSIVSWLTPERRRALESSLSAPVRCVSLLEGDFSFSPHPDFNPRLPGQVSPTRQARLSRSDLGRRGVNPLSSTPTMWVEELISTLDASRPVSVIGTGEFAYQPFLLAESLERAGFEVTYQSSTRSPILLGGAISESVAINDEHGEGVSNYLHNPPTSVHRQVIVAYESEECARRHELPEVLEATRWVAPQSMDHT